MKSGKGLASSMRYQPVLVKNMESETKNPWVQTLALFVYYLCVLRHLYMICVHLSFVF